MSLLNTLAFIVNHPLNRGRRLQSLARFLNWQIGSRLVPGAVVFEWVRGSKFVVSTGEAGLTGNIYCGLHEFADMAFLLHVLRPGDLFVDVGANVGSYTVLACSAAGARGVAFEPVPKSFERLVENVRLNNVESRVTLVNKAVGDRQGSLVFTRDSDTTNHVLAENERCSCAISVDVTTLDLSLRGESPALIKIDVEGFETPALAGAEEVLRRDSLHSVIMELNGSGGRYGYDEARIVELMFDCGFRLYSYDPLTRSLAEFGGAHSASDNALFIRDRDVVQSRLSAAPNVVVNGCCF